MRCDTYHPRRAAPPGVVGAEIVDPAHAWNALAQDWRALFEADPSATVFQHPGWFRAWQLATGAPTHAFVVRQGSTGAARALLVLRRTSTPALGGLLRAASYGIAGQPVINHVGLLCDPAFEAPALDALAALLIDDASWYRLHIARVSDPRILRLSERLRAAGFDVRSSADEPSPRADLTGSWDEFLRDRVTGTRRRELCRRERRAAEAGMRHAHAQRSDFERYLAAFHRLHRLRFGPATERYRALHDAVFRGTFHRGLLHANGIWHRDRLVAVQVGFVDRRRGTYHGCQAGWDPAYATAAVGTLVRAEAMRHAIALGLHTFDLGRELQDYKRDLCERVAPMRKVRVTRPGALDTLRKAFGRA